MKRISSEVELSRNSAMQLKVDIVITSGGTGNRSPRCNPRSNKESYRKGDDGGG